MDECLFTVFFIIFLIVLLVVCAEMYSTEKKIEDLTDRVKSLQHWMKSKDTHEKDLRDELNEKEEECFELRRKLNEMYETTKN
jgi:predicted Holliday junction resolvase-like endonuclease